jgi:ABC-type multidrug transport system ATPase subunit
MLGYTLQYIFKGLETKFNGSGIHAIIGPNGSGKSSLLRILSGFESPSKGTIQLYIQDKEIAKEHWHKHLSYAAPYIELIEEFTVEELFQFHSGLRSIDKTAFYEVLGLSNIQNKEIKSFSSGMKQKLKLSLCFLTESEVLLLDEPCSNLDNQVIDWYQEQLNIYSKNRLIVIASNQAFEYQQAEKILDITQYKN